MKKDVFPPDTSKTWIVLRLEEGEQGRKEVNHHVMSLYARPLEVYFLGTPYRTIGEPSELVQGFFADRLSRASYLTDWHKSGLRLRRWLMNGFSMYLKETARRSRADRRRVNLPVKGIAVDADCADALDRAFAKAIIEEALARAKDSCQSEGLTEHWTVFTRHFYDGVSYGDLVDELGITPSRAAVMARTAAQRFKRVLRDLVARDGACPPEIDDEIRLLLEITGA